MSHFLSIATAVPEHKLEAREGLAELRRFWPRLERLPDGEASVGTRYLCEPVDALLRPRSLSQRQVAYLHHSRQLAATAAHTALRDARLEGSDIDLIVTVSCTGYIVPALDVHLAPELGLRPDVLRLPITELGCTGGSAAIGFAHRHLQAFPDHRVLVIAVEVPSLNFQPADGSLDNLTASLVFGDGAGAAVLGPARRSGAGLDLLRAASYLVPGTADLLGFDLGDTGFHVVLDRRLPRIVERELGPALARFLAGSDLPQIDFFAAHAAGPRIFEAIERALQLPGGRLDPSREVFRAFGNTSSAAIFFALENLVENLGSLPAQGLGIGLGPGVSIELMHLAWTPSEHAGDKPRPTGERAAIGRGGVEETLLVPDAIEEDGGVHRR